MFVCQAFLPHTIRAQSGKNTNSSENEQVEIKKTDSAVDCKDELNMSEEYKYIVSKGIKNFIKKLNKHGKCGYKLEKLTYLLSGSTEMFDEIIMAAVVKRDTSDRYEYDWFEAVTPGEVVTRINLRAKKGFYFRDIIPFAQNFCPKSKQYSSETEQTEKMWDQIKENLSLVFGDIYFLEKKESEDKVKEYRNLVGNLGWGKKPTEELQRSLDEKVKENFHPVAIGSSKVFNKEAMTILVERDEDKKYLSPNLIYKIVRSEFSFEKNVNRLAKEGFKLALTGEIWAYRHAVMVKETENKLPLFSYDWINTATKSGAKEVINLPKDTAVPKFAVSRLTGCFYTESRLVFEKSNVENRSLDFKVINLTDKLPNETFNNDVAEAGFYPSEETTRKFQNLLKDGYVIQELFVMGNIFVILSKG